MIRFACNNCGKHLKAPDEKVGATGICPGCRAPITVPPVSLPNKVATLPLGPNKPASSPGPKARLAFSAEFVRDLRQVCDSEIEKVPDDCVAALSRIFEDRFRMVTEGRLKFFRDLMEVFASEGTKDPEDDIPLLGERFDTWRHHAIRRMKEYLSFLPNDDPLHCSVSLFGALGLGRVETAHTSALSWLLHPTREHGFGNVLIESLLCHLACQKVTSEVDFQGVLPEYHLLLGGKHLGRLDVFALGDWISSRGEKNAWMLAIEAKIDAAEGDSQLSRYDEWIDAHRGNRVTFRVFLTPNGRRPEGKESSWLPMSFLDLVRVFRGEYSKVRDSPGFHFLRYYLTGILKDICRWKVPLSSPESCNDPYGVLTYLRTVHGSNQGDGQ